MVIAMAITGNRGAAKVSIIEDLPEIIMSGDVDPRTAHNTKGARKAFQKMNERRRNEPLWKQQLRAHKGALVRRDREAGRNV